MMEQRQNVAALTIAGSDSGGGAGIQADLRTFAAHGVLGCSALTAVTAQNTRGVDGAEPLDLALVRQQMGSVLDDLPVRAVKTGMLANAAVVREVASYWVELADPPPLVVDPVMVAKSGDHLLEPAAIEAVRRLLLPVSTVFTPNRPEAAALLEADAIHDAEDALAALGSLAGHRTTIVLKGGHDPSDPERAVDLVRLPGGQHFALDAPRVRTSCTHGTGCTFSSAVAANLARGIRKEDALRRAKSYLTGALRSAEPVGAGHGPVDHLWQLRALGRTPSQ